MYCNQLPIFRFFLEINKEFSRNIPIKITPNKLNSIALVFTPQLMATWRISAIYSIDIGISTALLLNI